VLAKEAQDPATPNISSSSGILGPVCLLESSFFLESKLFSDVW